VSSGNVSFERVVIAVDPHKASWTAAAVSASLQPLATREYRSAWRAMSS
jgi:transposase